MDAEQQEDDEQAYAYRKRHGAGTLTKSTLPTPPRTTEYLIRRSQTCASGIPLPLMGRETDVLSTPLIATLPQSITLATTA